MGSCPKLTNQHRLRMAPWRIGHGWGLVVTPNGLEFRKDIMKTYCKDIDITDKNFISSAIMNYMRDKRGNKQLVEFFSRWSGKRFVETRMILKTFCNPEYIHYLKKTGTSPEDAQVLYDSSWKFFTDITDQIAEEMSEHLKNRTVWEHIHERLGKEKVIRYLEITDVGSGKRRDLGLECFMFRLYEVVANAAADPLFDAKVGMYQVASIKGKGQKFGKKAVSKWLARDPEGTKFGIQADISKCYPSIDHAELRGMFRRDLRKAPLIVYLFDTIIDLYEAYPNPKQPDTTKGILIGSPVSKDMCNYYMSRLYHYATEQLYKVTTRRNKVKRTNLVSHIIIYMDDVIIFGGNKKDIQLAMTEIVRFCKDKLKLSVKPNWRKFRTMYRKGDKTSGCLIDFMGFRFHCGSLHIKDYFGRSVKYKEVWITIRSSTFIKARRKLARFVRKVKRNDIVSYRFAKSLASYFGCFKSTDAATYRRTNKVDSIMKIARRIISNYAKGKPYNTDSYHKMWRSKVA